jgi:hypothetical protein
VSSSVALTIASLKVEMIPSSDGESWLSLVLFELFSDVQVLDVIGVLTYLGGTAASNFIFFFLSMACTSMWLPCVGSTFHSNKVLDGFIYSVRRLFS